MKTKLYYYSIQILYITIGFLAITTACYAQSDDDLSQYNRQLEQQIRQITLHNFEAAAADFDNAYRQYPSIPRGMLEAVSFTYTRFSSRKYSDTTDSEITSIPRTYSIMGLTLDGKGVFRENLRLVSQMSGVSIDSIIPNQSMAILSYAAAFANLQRQFHCYSDTIESYKPILVALSEIPLSDKEVDQFALNSSMYAIYLFLNDSSSVEYGVPPRNIHFDRLFTETQYQRLQQKQVTIVSKNHSKQIQNVDYPNAVWTPAGSCNYSNGRNGNTISDVVIHYTDGTYAGAISWFQNCTANGGLGAQVSAHYVLRSIDGQVTQMVREADKAWHVGTANGYTIGLEHEAYGNIFSYFTPVMYQSSADLVRDICERYGNISPLHIFYRDTLDDGTALNNGLHNLGNASACPQIRGHQHFPGQTHVDPGPYWNWNYYYKLINNATSIETVTSATGRFTDSGDSIAPYRNDERKLFLIHVAGADSIVLTFHRFNLERDYDFMWIYNGRSVFAPLIGRWNTQSPGRVVSSGEDMLVEFRSDCGSTADGWVAEWSSYFSNPATDHTMPTTRIIWNDSLWITDDFGLTFEDTDNVAVQYRFYQIMEKQGNTWSANTENGFFCDNFDYDLDTNLWMLPSNAWHINSHTLRQPDCLLPSANIFARLNQSESNLFLYDFYLTIDTGNIAAFYYGCDRPLEQMSLINGYQLTFDMVHHTLNLIKIINGHFRRIGCVEHVYYTPHQSDLYRIVWDRSTGTILVFRHATLLAEFSDHSVTEHIARYVGFETQKAAVSVDNMRVYRGRGNEIFCTVGSRPHDLLQVEALSGMSRTKIKSVVLDYARNFSAVSEKSFKVDYTRPIVSDMMWDGTGLIDIDTVYRRTKVSARWTPATDEQSGIKTYQYVVAVPVTDNIRPSFRNAWSEAGNTTMKTTNMYYTGRKTVFGIRAVDNAGLCSQSIYTDGVIYALSSAVSHKFGLYPNPATTQIIVRKIKDEETIPQEKYAAVYECILYNLQGEILYKAPFTEHTTISLTPYVSGLYLIQIIENDQVIYQEKIVKQ